MSHRDQSHLSTIMDEKTRSTSIGGSPSYPAPNENLHGLVDIGRFVFLLPGSLSLLISAAMESVSLSLA
jgi:hypothetical protein